MKAKTIIISAGPLRNSGIEVCWTKRRGMLCIDGWYDSMVGIEGAEFSLGEFFSRLGITEKDCRKAFAESKAP